MRASDVVWDRGYGQMDMTYTSRAHTLARHTRASVRSLTEGNKKIEKMRFCALRIVRIYYMLVGGWLCSVLCVSRRFYI